MYIRTSIPSKSNQETWHDYANSIVTMYPIGYMNIIQKQIPELLDQFKDLPYKKLGERFYNWMHPQCTKVCLVCSQPTQFKQFSHGYYLYCSCSCRAKDKKSNLNGLTLDAIDKRNIWRASLSEDDKIQIYDAAETTKIQRYGSNWHKKLSDASRAQAERNRPSQLNDKDWLYDQYVNQKKSKVQIAHELLTTMQVVTGACDRFNLPRLNNKSKSSVPEQQIVEFLQFLNATTITNDRSIISPYELDIVLPEHNIAIEFCGLYWHSSANPRITPNYHNHKRVLCNQKQLTLITIFEDEWIVKPDIVKNRLSHLVKRSSKSVGARKCVIKEVSNFEEKQFFNQYHIQGHRPSSVKYGLFYNNQLIAIMSFGKARYDKSLQWEMLRYATCGSIAGGASKLFNHFIREHQPLSVVSYSDNRWGKGGVYNNLGFKFDGDTKPSYFYFKQSKYVRYHRSTFMKHKIIATMNGDPSKTEYENMRILGYYRIWDCGTGKWVWRQP